MTSYTPEEISNRTKYRHRAAASRQSDDPMFRAATNPNDNRLRIKAGESVLKNGDLSDDDKKVVRGCVEDLAGSIDKFGRKSATDLLICLGVFFAKELGKQNGGSENGKGAS